MIGTTLLTFLAPLGFMPKEKDTSQQLLLNAAALLRKKGWTKNTLENGDGELCIQGAILKAYYGKVYPDLYKIRFYEDHSDTFQKAASLAERAPMAGPDSIGWINAKFLPRSRANFSPMLQVWNDDPRTTEHDVIDVLERAAALT